MWNATRAATLALTTLWMVPTMACDAEGGGPDDDAEDVGGKGDVPVSDDQLTNTTNNTLELRYGWDYLHDSATSNRCVETNTATAKGRDTKVGERQGTFDLRFVSDRSELATEMGLDLAMQTTYAGVGVDGKTNILNKFSKTSTSVSYLLKIRRDYTVRHRHELLLAEVGTKALEEGLDKFLGVCGTHYARGMRYGAELYVMITYKAADQTTATELKAELGVDAGDKIPGAELKTSMAAKLASSAKKAGVSVEVSVAAQGFTIDREQVTGDMIAKILGEGVSENMFGVLDDLYGSMQASIETDVCRDTGLDECWSASEKAASGCGGDGEEACGYYYNNSRGAIANGVAASLYTSLPNWDDEMDGDMEDAMKRIQDNEDYMRALGELLERMTNVYLDEIKPFRKASNSKKAEYNVPVGRKAKMDQDDEGFVPMSPDDLVSVSDVWEYEFLPAAAAGSSSQIGVAFERVEKEFKDCFQGTAVDLLAQCGPGDVDEQLEAEIWEESEGMLDAYDATGRVLPINYQHERDALVYYSDAVSRCEGTNFGSKSDKVFGRLPTKEEAAYLAPLVAYGNLDWGGADMRNAIWYEGSNNDGCGSGEARVMIAKPGSSEVEYSCVEVNFWGNEILPVCVPPQGPIGSPHRP
ncbi:MAG: hypothetical protein AAF721_14440 [Myxococcota bacterium]